MATAQIDEGAISTLAVVRVHCCTVSTATMVSDDDESNFGHIMVSVGTNGSMMSEARHDYQLPEQLEIVAHRDVLPDPQPKPAKTSQDRPKPAKTGQNRPKPPQTGPNRPKASKICQSRPNMAGPDQP